jgi:hypothetical protein
MDFKAQKRMYGMTDSDKKRIAEATKAAEEGDTSKSTPGGADKPVNLDDTGYVTYDMGVTNTWTEVEEKKVVNGVPE